MRKLILVLALLLPGCATVGLGNLRPDQAVYGAKSEFKSLLFAANTYKDQPACTDRIVVHCADPDVVKKLQDYALDADGKIAKAEAVVKAGGTGDASGAANIARAAVDLLANYLLTEKIQ